MKGLNKGGKDMPNSNSDMKTSIKELIDVLWREQTANWPLMQKGNSDLQELLTKDISTDNITFRAQHNPARIVSSGAKIDSKSIAARPCFLCRHNLPAEQKGLLLLGKYILLTNPFPIVSKHFTIPHIDHIPQKLIGDKENEKQNSLQQFNSNRIEEMARLAEIFSDTLDIYFNGAKCGASAPDHLHFQAGLQGTLPLMEQNTKAPMVMRDNGSIRLVEEQPRTVLLLQADSINTLCSLWSLLADALKEIELDDDRLNLVVRYTKETKWRLWAILRGKHRPDCYFREGEEQLLASPGVIDMSGIAVLPRWEDYSRITGDTWMRLMKEVSLPSDKFNQLMELLNRIN